MLSAYEKCSKVRICFKKILLWSIIKKCTHSFVHLSRTIYLIFKYFHMWGLHKLYSNLIFRIPCSSVTNTTPPRLNYFSTMLHLKKKKWITPLQILRNTFIFNFPHIIRVATGVSSAKTINCYEERGQIVC